MRTKNSGWVVEDALKGLYSQTLQDFELLVVDSGSRDQTLDIVRRYPAEVIRIKATDYLPGAVLNMAMEHTTGELAVFLNSDAVPQHPEALENLLAPLSDPLVAATFARQVPRPEAQGWVRRDYELSFPERRPAPEWMVWSLPLAAMRRSLWKQRRFYTAAWASEDTEWGLWAVKNGYSVVYVPEAIVMHSHNYTFRQLYGRRFVEGEADAFIYGDRGNLPKAAASWAKAVVNDVGWCVKAGSLRELPGIPARRLVYVWAHYRGHKLGEFRIARGDNDPSKGKYVALDRYE